jgi:hypothetical protein
MGKVMADRGVAVLAEVIAEVISEGKLAEIGVVSLPSTGLFAAGILAEVLQIAQVSMRAKPSEWLRLPKVGVK